MNEKPLTFEEWLGIFDALLDCDDTEAEEIFNAARQGLAGPPELVWGKIPNGYEIAKTPFGNYLIDDSAWSECVTIDKNKLPSYPAKSKNDAKAQAQEHFEKLWWEISKPAIEK